MSNILILTLVFPPDGVSTAQIMGALARDLHAKGHSVTVLTTSPHYNKDADAEAVQPLRRYWGSLLKKSAYHGIPVFHTLMPRKGKNVLLRLFAWTGFHLLGTFVGLGVVKKPDLILSPSPPLTIGLSAWAIGLIRRAPFIYNVQEIYPDIAVRLGALRNPKVIRFFLALERFVYRKSRKITVIAPRMRERLLEKGISPKMVEIIPNFVDIDELSPLPKDNSFSRKYDIADKFTVTYAGNMGVPQGLNTFVEAASLLKNERRIQFLMMGNGMQREALVCRIRELNLENIIVLPHQPYSLIPQIYAASDANLVPQAAETGFEAVPSKVYRIMACARPVLAVTEFHSDLARLVQDSGCGAVVSPGSAVDLADEILNAYKKREEWEKRGELGREYVKKYYSRSIVTNKYSELILSILSD